MACSKATSVCTKTMHNNFVHSTQSDEVLPARVVGQIGTVHIDCLEHPTIARCWFGSIAQPRTSRRTVARRRTVSSQRCAWQPFILSNAANVQVGDEQVMGTTTVYGAFAQWYNQMSQMNQMRQSRKTLKMDGNG